MNDIKYLALTIGPIYKTIESSRRTRMSWAGSYLFSYLIRELVFTHLRPLISDFDKKLIIPGYLERDPKKTLGAGIYTDKVLIRADDSDFGKIQMAIDELLKVVAEKIHAHINLTKWGFESSRLTCETEIEKYLHEYFQFYYIEMNIPDSLAEIPGEGDNIQKQLSDRLHVLELRKKHITDGSKDFLQHFLFRVNKFKRSTNQNSFLIEDAFGNNNGEKRRFDSLIEITTRGLLRVADQPSMEKAIGVLEHLKVASTGASNALNPYKMFVERLITRYQIQEDEELHNADASYDDKEDTEESQDTFLEALKRTYGENFRNYHKYIVVIDADGDNIGKALSKMGNDPVKLKKFSTDMTAFSCEAAKKFAEYGAAPVFIGGEDIVVFAPLACLTEKGDTLKTVFDVVNEVDELFGRKFMKYEVQDKDDDGTLSNNVDGSKKMVQPTLSWGISVGYYKHPLIDMRKAAHDLLNGAKNSKRFKNKNTIGFRLQKHSGHYFEAFIEKDKAESYSQTGKMIAELVRAPNQTGHETNSKLLNGIAQRLKDGVFSLLLELAVKEGTLEHFFKNSFNESIHKQREVKQYLEDVQAFIKSVYSAYPKRVFEGKQLDEAKDIVYTTLRLIHFINSKDED